MSTDNGSTQPSVSLTKHLSGSFDNTIALSSGGVPMLAAAPSAEPEHHTKPPRKSLLKGLFDHTVAAAEVSGVILATFTKLGFDVTTFSAEQTASLLKQTTHAIGQLTKITKTDIEAGVNAVIYTHSIHSIFEENKPVPTSGPKYVSKCVHKLFDKILGHSQKKVEAVLKLHLSQIPNPAELLAKQVARDNPDNPSATYNANAHKDMVKATIHKGFLCYLENYFQKFTEIGAGVGMEVVLNAATDGAAAAAGATGAALLAANPEQHHTKTPLSTSAGGLVHLVQSAVNQVTGVAGTVAGTLQGGAAKATNTPQYGSKSGEAFDAKPTAAQKQAAALAELAALQAMYVYCRDVDHNTSCAGENSDLQNDQDALF